MEHECFENIEINEGSKGSGYYDYLKCSVCNEVYERHRFICWIRPYPHLSDIIIEKLLSFLSFEFTDDIYSEVEPADYIFDTYPEFYNNLKWSNTLIKIDKYGLVESKGSYFLEFSDEKTYKELSKKLNKLSRYCEGWCQDNI